MNLAPLVAESSSHSVTKLARPWCTALPRHTNVESDRRVDVPEAQSCNRSEKNDVAWNQKQRIEIEFFLRDCRGCLCPWEDVGLAKKDHEQQNERHWEESDIAFHESSHRRRPSRSRDSLNSHEHHACRRHAREVQPVEKKRAPRSVGRNEQADHEHDQTDNREDDAQCSDPFRQRPRRSRKYLLATRHVKFVAHRAFFTVSAPGFMNGAGRVGAVVVNPGTLSPVTPG